MIAEMKIEDRIRRLTGERREKTIKREKERGDRNDTRIVGRKIFRIVLFHVYLNSCVSA